MVRSDHVLKHRHRHRHPAPLPADMPARRRRRRTRGQALVEFSLVIPVFFLVLAGVLDFGFMLYSRMTVINAAREGARAAVTASDRSTVPSVAEGRATAMASGLVLADLSVSTSCVALVSTSCNWSSPTSAQAGDAVTVTVSYTYRTFFPLLFGSTMDLSSAVQMVLE
jgi:Flp pilus assembly protein TadG